MMIELYYLHISYMVNVLLGFLLGFVIGYFYNYMKSIKEVRELINE